MDTLVNIGKYSNPMDEIGTCHQPRLPRKNPWSVVFFGGPTGRLALPHLIPTILHDWVTGAQPTASHGVPNVLSPKKHGQNCHSCDIKQHVNCQLTCVACTD